ncbi:MAG: DUF72 domain-containing protein [Bacteroidetes bacterium]|nr:DUF72 domain-containing protein [Bacteroidota bacterium]
MKTFHIGCSGYYYPNWKNKFYPAGTAPKNWLEYYSTVFNTVELNGTFYRTPKLSDLKKYAAVTPKDFTFSVKMNKYITHTIKMKDSGEDILKLQGLIMEGLQNKLSCFLFQLPPSFHYSDENLERIINNIPPHAQNVIEFRHISWWNDDVVKAFKKAKLTFCNIDHPAIKSFFIRTTPYFYLRLHGNPELFKSSYAKSELENFSDKFPATAKFYSVYFNNTYYEAGYTNALQLMNIIEK